MFKRILLSTVVKIFLFSGILHAQNRINPVIPGDFADPTVILAGKEYFAVGTSSEWAPHFPIYKSSDLINWKQTSYVFEKAPAWTVGSFWAPEYSYHNGTYFIYYTARRKKDNISCIGVATSKHPDKEFVDHGVIIELGKEAIDAFVYADQGKRYITFKAYGLDKRPIEILRMRLSDDGLSTIGKPFTLLRDDTGAGLEGQSILKHGDYFYIFYSAGNCCGVQCSYNVNVARAKSFDGPYEQYVSNPILDQNPFWKCSGHGTFVKAPNGKINYLYHAYNKQATVFAGRQGVLAALNWSDKTGWPSFKEVSGSAPFLSEKIAFNNNQLDKRWQWDFRHSSPVISQNNGKLNLSGNLVEGNLTGLVIALRPNFAAFEARTAVVNFNSALKGLAYYGDAGAALGIGVKEDQVQFWMVKDSVRTVLMTSRILAGKPVELKIKVADNSKVFAYYKQGNENWKALLPNQAVSSSFLPQWDRSPRIGVHIKGAPTIEASFSYFEIKY